MLITKQNAKQNYSRLFLGKNHWKLRYLFLLYYLKKTNKCAYQYSALEIEDLSSREIHNKFNQDAIIFVLQELLEHQK
jgi:hypothetical protein